MISFNQHFLLRAGIAEDVWLNEALSHLSEDLAGFPEANRGGRTQLFLDAPNAFSLLAADGANWENGEWLTCPYADSVMASSRF